MFFIAMLFLQHVISAEWKSWSYSGAVMFAEFASASGDEKVRVWSALAAPVPP